MITIDDPHIRFVRLPRIRTAELISHMSDPRVTAHMPLATATWDQDFCDAFVATKEACWARDGLGHCGVLYDDVYVGWGGFQKEGGEWDFGLVLKPERFGLGLRIVQLAIDWARAQQRIAFVTFLLPPSRKHLAGLARLGAHGVGEVEHGGETFLKYRLDTPVATP